MEMSLDGSQCLVADMGRTWVGQAPISLYRRVFMSTTVSEFCISIIKLWVLTVLMGMDINAFSH
jgi:hypothetical protein